MLPAPIKMFGSLLWTCELKAILKLIAYLRCTLYISSTSSDRTMFVFFSSQMLERPPYSRLLYIVRHGNRLLPLLLIRSSPANPELSPRTRETIFVGNVEYIAVSSYPRPSVSNTVYTAWITINSGRPPRQKVPSSCAAMI